MTEVCEFIPARQVRYDVGVAVEPGGTILWAGMTSECPLDRFPVGTVIFVNPEYLNQLEARVRLVDEGIPREPTPAPSDGE